MPTLLLALLLPLLAPASPDTTGFVRTVLADHLNEPMELDRLPDGRILLAERRGALKLYDPADGRMRRIDSLAVHTRHEDGLLGLALDPDFAENRWVYLFYSPPAAPQYGAPHWAVFLPAHAGVVPVQHVSRFRLTDAGLDRASEQVLLTIPVDRLECCHSAGSLEFGPDGTLYIAVGDDTNPFASDGFAPIDERPGRSAWDAQRSSANPNDLRGKILRIRPLPDGTYAIPPGNLFPADGSAGRPEIYAMGLRNPFRISLDPHTGTLYWGDVGPDASVPLDERGPAGHDEVNRTDAPGFFGWPYFVADNRAYRDYHFADSTHGDAFDAAAPVNDSPHAPGGPHALPPARPAWIYYPYGPSEAFPEVEQGGRTAMAGPVYHAADYAGAPHAFPQDYDGRVFIYEWMRDWIMTVTVGSDGAPARLERFLPDEVFANPVDMLFAPDGALYVLEYGSNWNEPNPDARLSRIVYAGPSR